MATDLEKTRWEFVTRSENPSVYTKLSCFLPWIAEQYSLKFDDRRLEKECLTGTGGESKSATNRQKNEEEGNVCRIVPSTIIDLVFETVYCLSDPTDQFSELDPTLVVGTDCTTLQAIPAFKQCKNDCPGGKKTLSLCFTILTLLDWASYPD